MTSRDIRILVVDDEYIVRNWLSLLIEKNGELGFSLAGSVPSGARAAALCRETPVDVVITDIKMAPMDGIELIRTLKPLCPALRFIIISNYEDFLAAQEGIRLGASDYFLKAEVEDTDILACLLRLRRDILASEEADAPAAQRHPAEEADLLRQQYLLNLFRENPLNETRGEQLRQVGVALGEDRLRIAVFSFDHLRRNLKFTSPEYQQFLQLVNRQLGNLTKKAAGVINTDGNLIALMPGGIEKRQLDGELAQILMKLRQRQGAGASVAVSEAFDGLDRCASVYRETVRLLEQRFYTGGGIICEARREAEDSYAPAEAAYGDELARIRRRIHCFEYRSAYQQIRTLLGEIARARSVRPGEMRQLCRALLQEFTYKSDGAPAGGAADDIASIPLCGDLIKATLDALEDNLHRRTAQLTRTEPVEMAVDYIHDNFSENISLPQVAALVHLSESYLSKRFKEKTGESFNTYLSRCRINHAKYLLRNSNARVGTIGSMVGYPNVSYFTQVFKKATGQSPEQYRGASRRPPSGDSGAGARWEDP